MSKFLDEHGLEVLWDKIKKADVKEYLNKTKENYPSADFCFGKKLI